MTQAPFKLPVWIDKQLGFASIVADDHELVAEVTAVTEEELTHIVRAINSLPRLLAIADAAQNLVKQKGRFNTEQAYRQLEEALR